MAWHTAPAQPGLVAEHEAAPLLFDRRLDDVAEVGDDVLPLESSSAACSRSCIHQSQRLRRR